MKKDSAGRGRRIVESWIWVFAVCALYLGPAWFKGMRPFWYDELFTLYVSQLSDMPTIWTALKDGADLNPPLFYGITRLSTALLGPSELGLRMPAIVGYLVLCLSLQVFVRRRMGAGMGLVAMLTPMLAGPMFYATEARAYGLVLGFVGLAMVCWQNIEDGRSRTLSLAGLGICLSAALLTHCYAVLILVPFGLAELTRSWDRKKIDWGACLAISLPMSLVLSYLPLMAAVSPFAVDSEVFRPTFWSIPLFYNFLTYTLRLPIILVAVALGALLIVKWKEVRFESAGYTKAELSLAAGFLLVPFLAVLLAATVTHIYMRRYGLAAVCGLAILLPLLFEVIARRRRHAGTIAAAVFALSAVVEFSGWPKTLEAEAIPFRRSMQLENVTPELPLVVSSGLLFLEMNHYASPRLIKRMHFLADASLARQLTGTDVFDKSFPQLRRWFPIRAALEDAQTYLRSHKRFLIYGYQKHPMDWLVPYLKSLGWQLTILESSTERVLYLSESPLLVDGHSGAMKR